MRSRSGAETCDTVRDRPAGWLLLLWPTLAALWIAAGGFPGWHLLAVFTLGTILMRSAGCCINDVADRDFDKHVKRTAQRPVTRGALSVKQALVCGAVLTLAAFGLVLTTNAVTIAWSFAALAVTLAYPYAKRVVAMPQAVLGVAFSFGIPMAFAAAQGGADWSLAAVNGAVPPHAWWLLLGNLFRVQHLEVDRRQVDRREARTHRRVGDRLAGIREQQVRASNGNQRLDLLIRHIHDAENTSLTDFNQENRLFAQFGSHRHRQHHFENTFTNATATGDDINPPGWPTDEDGVTWVGLMTPGQRIIAGTR